MKKCYKCQETKDKSEFYKHKSKKDGLQDACKSCWGIYCSSAERKKKRNETNLKNDINQNRKEYFRTWRLGKKYGITVERYNEIFNSQNGCCETCGKNHIFCQNGLYVDHDHNTGKVRGLLCRECNSGIGYFKESVEVMKNVINYLNIHKGVL